MKHSGNICHILKTLTQTILEVKLTSSIEAKKRLPQLGNRFEIYMAGEAELLYVIIVVKMICIVVKMICFFVTFR